MIYVVLGTKAQLIKMAPVLMELRDRGLEYKFISTGQHKETTDDILANFQISGPEVVLYQGHDIVSIRQMLAWGIKVVARAFRSRQVLFPKNNGLVLVHGDTASTLLGALIAKLAGQKVGHVEAGLRSYNYFHPFPEELIRIAVGRLADIRFCPGQWAVQNVSGYRLGRNVDIGANTLQDSLRIILSRHSSLDLPIPDEEFGVVSIHRFENIKDKRSLLRIVELIELISGQFSLLFILHKPTERKLRQFGLFDRLSALPGVEFRHRYDYLRFMRLVMAAKFVISDGGSNQEECFYLDKPLLLLRAATERQEGLGKNCVLSEYAPVKVKEFMESLRERQPTMPNELLGSPSARIVDVCEEYCVE
ncbi:UDP-N-acetylglucosamine 2-epimerase [Pseudomonas sp. 273]|uniref:UDP-N-acetylglucosamine 2-epimerase n=1 Tax=Pseudomonas sp. 273 TaxID=75692 RepID=UPI0023D81497|nr:UDP-N-acetylglucosamine 2-epimerase [Pseudomonas sp. 273]